MLKVTVSVVNYNAGNYLVECLGSIEKAKEEIDLMVYVVDNASSDDSIEKARSRYPRNHYILNKENIGFGKAENQVLRQVKTGYVLILNPDVILQKGAMREMWQFMEENPQVGAATCQLVHEDGSLDWAAHRGFPTPLASLLYFFGNDVLYHLRRRNFNKPHEVDAISGSFFLTRKSVLDKIGYFDEAYFMYAEDIDLCLRIKEAGFKVMYVPTVAAVHYKGISSGLKEHTQHLTAADVQTRLRALNAFYETMKIFYQKHYRSRYPFFVNWLVFLGIDIKWWLAKRKLSV